MKPILLLLLFAHYLAVCVANSPIEINAFWDDEGKQYSYAITTIIHQRMQTLPILLWFGVNDVHE